MSAVIKSPQFATNVRGLLSRCTKLTLRPFYTRQLLRSRRSQHSSSNNSPRGIVTKLPATDKLFEEERLPDYEAEQFYPVNIGDTINSRYYVIGKLGYGANSTVWFCRDLSNDAYVVLKVYVRTLGKVNREISFYNHVNTISTSHPGSHHIRHVVDMFSLESTSGDVHECLVHLPLQITLYTFQRPGGKPRSCPEELAKSIMKHLLEALDFLHAEANVTHCDLKLSNIMFGVEDESVFEAYEEAEMSNPSRSKTISKVRKLYVSRPFRKPRDHAYGSPILCDFGEARMGTDHAHVDIQPEIYKAPEILMEIGWTHSVDIWNAACLVWEMVEAKYLFHGYSQEGRHNSRLHMHEIVCLLGEPPSTFLERRSHTWRLFGDDGKWKAEPHLAAIPLEARPKILNGESREQFLDFIGYMLRWLPEERWNAHQLLQHSWLKGVD